MSYDLTFPARKSIDVSARLNESGAGYLDVKNIRSTGNTRDQFEVSGIIVSQGSETATTVRGFLMDDPISGSETARDFPIACNIPVGLRFARIYQTGTDATKLILLGQ